MEVYGIISLTGLICPCMSMNRVPLQEVTLFGHAMMVLSPYEQQLMYKAVEVVAVHFKHRSQ